MAQSGADLTCRVVVQQRTPIDAYARVQGVLSVAVSRGAWDKMTPAAVRTEIARAAAGRRRPGWPDLSAKGPLPAMFVFRTREGGTGLLQILAITEKPWGLKLRYKLLQQPRVGAASLPAPKPAAKVQTYVVVFKARAGRFRARTAGELLTAFNEKLPRGVRTHHFRTSVQRGELLGYICVDREAGKAAVVDMLAKSSKLVLVSAKPATQADLQKLYRMGQPSLPSERPPSALPVGRSVAWYILPEASMIGDQLLAGLHRQLAKFAGADDRTDRVWTGVRDGGQAEVDITVAEDVKGEILVGFFSKPTWDAAPVQVRTFSGPGQYIIKALPPGKWQVGAIGRCDSGGSAAGVCSSWPSPVEIKPGQIAAVRLRLWRDYYQSPKPPPGQLNRQNLLQGRVLDPAGKPIAHATIQIRQKREPGMTSLAAPDVETDEKGRYVYDQMAWPYRVGAIWREPLPSVPGFRHQYVGLNRFHKGSQTVDFQFKSFPAGTAVLAGKVSADGRPVRRFVVDLRNKVNWKDRSGESIYQFGWRLAFITNDGTFKLTRLPAGTFNVSVHPFRADRKTYNIASREVTLKAEQTTRVAVGLPVKTIYYGRVLFEDGKPAFLDPPPWKGADVNLTVAGERAVTDRDGYFALPLTDEVLARLKVGAATLWIYCAVPDVDRNFSRLGDFPAHLLSTDRAKAGTVKVAAAKPWMQRLPAHVGRAVADFELPRTDGKSCKLSDYKGKVVLLNIFATWCGPCMDEMPHLAEAHKKFADKGLVILAISREEQPDVVKKFASEEALPFPVLIDGEGKATGQFADADGKVTIPRTFLLDRTGRIVFAAVGFTKMGSAALLQAIERALAGPATAAAAELPWLELTGRVVDGKTGQPVERYAIQRGWPDRADPAKVVWGGGYGPSRHKDGRFRLRRQWPPDRRAWFRILAGGYLPAPITPRPVVVPATLKNLVVRLRRGREITGRVLDHTGKAVAGAHVLVGAQTVELVDGQAELFAGSWDLTDKQGQFRLSGVGSEEDVIVVSAPGLNVWHGAVPKAGEELTVRLPEPAKLVVRYAIPGDQDECELRILMASAPRRKDGAMLLQSRQSALVRNGRQTVVANLAAGEYYVGRYKLLRLGNIGHGRLCDRRTVRLRAGQTMKLDFVRTAGARVEGQVLGLKQAGASSAFIWVLDAGAMGGRQDLRHGSNLFDALTCKADGRFTTALLEPGSYAVIVETAVRAPMSETGRTTARPEPNLFGRAVVTVPKEGKPPPVRIQVKPRSSRPAGYGPR